MNHPPSPHRGRRAAVGASPAQAGLSPDHANALASPTERFARTYAAEERAMVDAVADGRTLGDLEILVLQHRTARMTNALKAHVGALGQYHEAAKKVIENV